MIVNENEVNDFFRNKTVAIVGPSGYLMNKNIGNIIDSYDIVCRLNEEKQVCFMNDYGSKTEVVFHCMNSIEGIPSLRKEFLNEENDEYYSKIKYFIMPHYRYDDKGVDVVSLFEIINNFNLPLYYIGDENYFQLKNEIKVKPNTGMISICMILKYKIKELFITGISFYEEYREYGFEMEKHYYPGKVTPAQKISSFNPLISHDQEMQKRYLINDILKKNEDKIMIDSVLQNILSIEYKNVLKVS